MDVEAEIDAIIASAPWPVPTSLRESYMPVIALRSKYHAAKQATLSPRDPEHDEMFIFDGEGWEIYWGNSNGYGIGLSQVSTPQDALWFVEHIARKSWQHATPARISLLIADIRKRKGWAAQWPSSM